MDDNTRHPRRVLISGAAGGVGQAAARRFVADGAQVALTDVNADTLRSIAADVGAAALPADGTNRDEVADVVAQAVDQLGGLDCIVAAQGAAIPSVPSPKADAGWFSALDVNLHGTYFLCTEALPYVVKSRGSMVMIASTAGLLAGPPGAVGYSAAKTALVGLMRWLARDLGPRGVRVNAVCPGWIRTQIAGGAMEYLSKREGITLDEAFDLTTRHVPLRRVAEPAEIASVCAFLASTDASMITGQAIAVDGGASAADLGTAALDPT